MNFTQRDTHPAPDAIWSTELRQPPAGPLLVVGDLLLVPTQEPSQPFQHSALHALSLADGSPRWQRSFEHALVSGLASTHTPTLPLSHTPTLPHPHTHPRRHLQHRPAARRGGARGAGRGGGRTIPLGAGRAARLRPSGS